MDDNQVAVIYRWHPYIQRCTPTWEYFLPFDTPCSNRCPHFALFFTCLGHVLLFVLNIVVVECRSPGLERFWCVQVLNYFVPVLMISSETNGGNMYAMEANPYSRFYFR